MFVLFVLSISSISVLILCKKVSSVLSDSLSGFSIRFGFVAKGSLGFVGFGLDVVLISYVVLILCIKSRISLCKACICKSFGFGMNVSPFLRTCFCASVRVVLVASITKASSVSSVLRCLCFVFVVSLNLEQDTGNNLYFG